MIYVDKATETARAALAIPASVCSIFVSVLGIVSVCTDADACDCTQGL